MSSTFPDRETSKLIEASSQGCADYITSARATAGRCPYCHGELDVGGVANCRACGTRQHTDCLIDHGACAVTGCEALEVEFDGVTVPITDLPPGATPIGEWRASQDDDREWESELAIARLSRQQLGRNLVAGSAGLTIGLIVLAAVFAIDFRAGGVFATISAALTFVRVRSWLVPDPSYKPGPGASLWHDVYSYGGFDPVTGMGPPPMVQSHDTQDGSEPIDSKHEERARA